MSAQHNKIALREMMASDIEALVERFCFPWTTKEQTIEKWTRYLREHQKEKRTVYLIENEEQIIGYASLLYSSNYAHFKDSDIPEIHDVWILENFRKLGFASMLIRHIEKMAQEKGYKQIGLSVGLYQDYGPAQILYYKLGYIPDGNGVTYKALNVVPGQQYPVDDDLLLWLTKSLN